MVQIAGGIILALILIPFIPWLISLIPAFFVWLAIGTLGLIVLMIPVWVIQGILDKKKTEADRKEKERVERLYEEERKAFLQKQERQEAEWKEKRRIQDEEYQRLRAWMDELWKPDYLTLRERSIVYKATENTRDLTVDPANAPLEFDEEKFPELSGAAERLKLFRAGKTDAAKDSVLQARQVEFDEIFEYFRKSVSISAPNADAPEGVTQSSTLRSLGFLDEFGEPIREHLDALHSACKRAKDSLKKQGNERIRQIWLNGYTYKHELKNVVADPALADAPISEVFRKLINADEIGL